LQIHGQNLNCIEVPCQLPDNWGIITLQSSFFILKKEFNKNNKVFRLRLDTNEGKCGENADEMALLYEASFVFLCFLFN
jgi:hypothetical protein